MNISKNIELTPHILRRCFATYQAISGMPLPVLQQVLGHSSIRTTALYWKSTQESKEKFISDKWLTGKLPQEPEKTIEIKPKELINIPIIKNNWEISINIQKIIFFIPKPVNFSDQKLLAVENKLLQSKLRQLEQENNQHKKTIENLKNDREKLEKKLIQTQQEKNILLKMLSVDLKRQQQNLSHKEQNSQGLHQQLTAQIQVLIKINYLKIYLVNKWGFYFNNR